MIREVCMACNPGLGHFHPDRQLAEAVVSSSEDVHCTMFIPIDKSVKATYLSAGEVIDTVPFHEQKHGIQGELLRCSEKVDCVLWTIPNDADICYIFNLFCDFSDDFVESVKQYYASKRQQRPFVVIGDVVISYYIEVAEYYNVQCWQFSPSPITLSEVIQYLPEAWDAGKSERIEQVPGLGPLNVVDMMQAPEVITVERFSRIFKRFLSLEHKLSGLLANDVADWYPKELLTNLEKRYNHQVLCLGPLALNFDHRTDTNHVESWLNQFPDHSVLYVSFGSTYNPEAAHFKELAAVISALPCQVIWSLRSPFLGQEGYNENGLPADLEYPKVRVERWVNQPKVLAHPAIGAFLSHCGWNSTLESCIEGVPMICVPLIAEQHLNTLLIERNWVAGKTVMQSTTQLKPSSEIIDIVNEVMHNRKYADNAAKVGQLCRNNAARVATFIDTFMKMASAPAAMEKQ